MGDNMTSEELKVIFELGEDIAHEFKRCSNGIHDDVYESVCSFLNRFGGEIFLGVENDGSVTGVSEVAINDMIRNFIKVIGNPDYHNVYVKTTCIFREKNLSLC